MSVQTVSALLTLLAVLALAGIFLHVRIRVHAARDYVSVQGRAYRIRAIGFAILMLVGLPVTIYLLRVNPYAAAAGAPQVVNVNAAQWYWEFDRTDLTARQPVEFRVTSVDVNHGLGIYDQAGRLVAQTQAMPGYVNRLTHVFERPGTYQVLCLEYCGLAHHNMLVELEITEGTGGRGG